MKKHKIISGISVSLCLVLVVVMFWQDQKIKKEIIWNFVLEHSVIESTLKNALNDYEKYGNQTKLSEKLNTVKMQVHRAADLPRISQLNGTSYSSSIPYLYEITDNLDYNFSAVLSDAVLSVRYGTLTDKHLQELSDYSKLFTSFIDTTLTKDFREKSLYELENNLASFYSTYRKK